MQCSVPHDNQIHRKNLLSKSTSHPSINKLVPHFIEMGFDSVDMVPHPSVHKDSAVQRVVSEAVGEWHRRLLAAILLLASVQLAVVSSVSLGTSTTVPAD